MVPNRCVRCTLCVPVNKTGLGNRGVLMATKEQQRAYNRRYHAKHPERVRKTRRESKRKQVYGVTPEQYDKMVKE